MCTLLLWIPPGGAAVSAAPTEQAVKKLPRNTPNTQNFLQRKDSHRWHGCAQIRRVWHPCHTHAAKFCVFCEFCGRTAHPKYLCKSVKSVGGHLSRRFCEFGVFCGRTVHPKYLCKSVKSVGEKIFPQNARNAQKLLAEKSLPQMSTDAHRCRRVWHPCHTHATKFCVFCEFCGRTAHPKYLCKSVKSVGGKIFPQNARNSQNLLQRKDSHGWHGCSQM